MKKTKNKAANQLTLRAQHETNYKEGDYCVVENVPQYSILESNNTSIVNPGEAVQIIGESITREQSYAVRRASKHCIRFHILHEKDLRLLQGEELTNAKKEFENG